MSVYDRDYMQPSRGRWSFGNMRWSAFGVVFWLNIVIFVCQYLAGWFVDNHNGIVIPKGGVSLELLTQGKVWTIFTYMFVHGSLGHVLLNMLMLWFVGRQVQQIFGGAHFLRIYIFGGLLGAALEIAIRSWFGPGDVYLVGASASIFALFLALAITLPNDVLTVLLYFVIPVRVRMWRLATIMVGINLLFGFAGLFWQNMPGADIAYFAHLGGALTGWYYVRMLGYGNNPMTYRQLWSTPPEQPHQMSRSERLKQQLKLVPSQKRQLTLDIDSHQPDTGKNEPAAGKSGSLMRDEVDPILDKISEHGFHSITEEERRILERASKLVSRNKDSK